MGRWILKFMIVLFVFSLGHPSVFAQGRWTHYGVRPLGMGNAFVAVVDDYNAIFYNPAGLSKLDDWSLEIINPSLEVSLNSVSAIQSLLSSMGSMDFDTALDFIEAQAGLPQHFSLSMSPTFVHPNFGVGIGLQAPFVNLVMHSNIDIDAEILTQVIAPISFAFDLIDDKLSFGFSLKALLRAGVDQELNIDSLSVFSDPNSEASKKLLMSGFGVGADVGFLFTPMETMEPTFGLSITDVGGSSYNALDKTHSLPSVRLPSVNTGVSFKPIKTNHHYLLVALDTHSINQPKHFSKKLNLGLEWGLSKILKLQTGLMAGHLTAGMQFDVNLLKVRLATYVVDYGPVAGLHEKLADRRVMLQFKLLL